jgi:hypothetical protein
VSSNYIININALLFLCVVFHVSCFLFRVLCFVFRVSCSFSAFRNILIITLYSYLNLGGL